MQRKLLIFISGFIGLLGSNNPAYAGLFSATGPVIAIFADELFLGVATGNFDGSGTIKIQSRSNLDLTCSGQFTSSAKLGGKGTLQCSDNTSATIKFKRLSIRRGYGTGNSSRGTMSFTYGLSANDSLPYLKLPTDKALRQVGKEVDLVEEVQPIPGILPISSPISAVKNASDSNFKQSNGHGSYHTE